jgi:hypothetical protein
MKKFLVLYRSSASNKEQLASVTPEQSKAMMDAWMKWAHKAGSALVEMGAPVGDATLLKGSANPNHIGGYSFVQAESIEAAKSLFDGHPHFESPAASIELLEVMPLPGM